MPSGLPDFEAKTPTDPTIQVVGLDEFGTRLTGPILTSGPVNTTIKIPLSSLGPQSRSGRWIWATDFQNVNLAPFDQTGGDTGWTINSLTPPYYVGATGANVSFLSGGAQTNAILTLHTHLMPGSLDRPIPALGIEALASVSVNNGVEFRLIVTYWNDHHPDPTLKNQRQQFLAHILWNAGGALSVSLQNRTGTTTILNEVGAATPAKPGYYNYFKMVVDPLTNHYLRFYANENIIDVSSQLAALTVSANQNQTDFGFQFINGALATMSTRLANVIMTSDEPT